MPAYRDTETSELSFIEQFYEMFGEPEKDSGDSLVFVCPKCFHKSLSCSKTKGLFHCFYCNYGKGQRLYSNTQVVSAPRVNVNHEVQLAVSASIVKHSEAIPKYFRDFFTKRGIHKPQEYCLGMVPLGIDSLLLREGYTKEILIESGYFYHDEYSNKLRAKSILEPGRFVIPYFNFGNIISLKTRFNPNYAVERSDIRYLNPPNSKLSQYVYFFKKRYEDCIITEGELKAISVESQFPINCASIPGFNTYKNCIDQIYSLTKMFRRVYISLDTAKLEKIDNLINAALDIYEQLRERGSSNTCIAFPQTTNEESECKIDDYFLELDDDAIDYFLEYTWNKREEIYELCKGLQNSPRDREYYKKVCCYLH